jgi:hypothetical protein
MHCSRLAVAAGAVAATVSAALFTPHGANGAVRLLSSDAPLVTKTRLVHARHSSASARTGTMLTHFGVPAPPGYIDFAYGECAGIGGSGCMFWRPWGATVRIRPRFAADSKTFAHELGHVFDMYVLATTGMRPRFAQIDGHPWKTPASEERFAQAYELCAHRRQLEATVRSAYYGFSLSPSQFSATCQLIRVSYAAWLDNPATHRYGQHPPWAQTLTTP